MTNTSVFFQVLNLFLLMALGYFLAKKEMFSKEVFSGLNTFVAFFALPALSFSKLQRPYSADLLPSISGVFFLGGGLMVLVGLLAMFLFRKESRDRQVIFSHLVTFSNCGFMGYPIITAAFGEEALLYGVIFVTVFNIVSWTLGVYWFAGKEGISLKKFLLNPTLIAATLGLLLFFLNIRLPAFPLNAIAMIGDTTTPLSMLVVGSQLIGLKASLFKDRSFLLASITRLVFLPLVFWLIFHRISLPPMVFNTIYICLAMPGAAVTVIQAKQFQLNESLAAQAVAFTTTLSVLTIPLSLLLL